MKLTNETHRQKYCFQDNRKEVEVSDTPESIDTIAGDTDNDTD